MQILPDRATHRAGNSNVMVQTAESLRDRGLDQVVKYFYAGPGLYTHIIHALDALHFVANDEAAVALVTDEDVRAEPEQKEWDLQLACRGYGRCELLWRPRTEEVVGGAADLERRERREWHVVLHPLRAEPSFDFLLSFIDHVLREFMKRAISARSGDRAARPRLGSDSHAA